MSRFDLFFVLVDDCNEVTDYAIARRIVELHSQQELEQQPVYTLVSTCPYLPHCVFIRFLIRRRSGDTCYLLDSSCLRSVKPVWTIWWRSTRNYVRGTVLVGVVS